MPTQEETVKAVSFLHIRMIAWRGTSSADESAVKQSGSVDAGSRMTQQWAA